MTMARSGASASLIDNKKIYVFGGCWDWDVAADSSNWAEVYDVETGTWEFLSVVTPKMPLKIQQSLVMDDEKHVHAVDEDGQIFNFSSTECKFEAAEDGRTESNPSNWLFADQALFCPATGGRILWRFPFESDWKDVKGLEQLQQQHSGFHIIKLSISGVRLAIFWEARPQGPDGQILELWYAELSIATRRIEGVFELSVANIEWSGAVLSLDSSSTGLLNLLFADSFYL
ncbi:PREDICTED: F-box/kelch-repeat protein SKIP6-like [Camelina sativa]|uniref:F-box/kelch-repeat protein SKIP6-like n=1 Tax=Camelina sativa TaxID=90675 RepID=A0ABM0TCB3_CAMSA|nr:PREDICTED: F-box/kelch-repeat protein SKIP6-like [Camelina sativa]